MFTLPVGLPLQPRTDQVLAFQTASSRARFEAKGKKHPSRVTARNRRRVRISSVGNGRCRKRVSGSRYGEGSVSKENSVCSANERNHLQPLKQTCFNYTLISSINTPHSGRAGRRRCGADNYQPTPDYTRRRRRGERLKNVTALTVAAKLKGAAFPSWRPLLKHSKASDGRSGRSRTKTPADGSQTEGMGQFGLLSPLKASKVEYSSPQELASPPRGRASTLTTRCRQIGINVAKYVRNAGFPRLAAVCLLKQNPSREIIFARREGL